MSDLAKKTSLHTSMMLIEVASLDPAAARDLAQRLADDRSEFVALALAAQVYAWDKLLDSFRELFPNAVAEYEQIKYGQPGAPRRDEAMRFVAGLFVAHL